MKGFVLGIALMVFGVCAHAEETSFRDTDLPLPRYVSLASDEVNVRSGPGLRYPIKWVYIKKGFPVEIIREFEHWREIRDFEGQAGWVHKTLLTGQRSVLILKDAQFLKKAAAVDAPPVAQVEAGVVGWVDSCKAGWCRLDVSGYKGWMTADAVWGLRPGEELD